MKHLRFIALALTILGALNAGTVGLFQFDFLSAFFGSFTPIALTLIGLAGLYSLTLFSKCWGCGCECGSKCKCCKK